ncbi:TPA: hypothetical protein RPE00_001811 [Salmonella enterica]|nr:hypothetical protein [Salmonella enterica subsp. arizonae]EKS2758986.1 hypothetical protein [Salmonella enterica]HDY3838062.1 hypothetical protein [Salmonella enterica]
MRHVKNIFLVLTFALSAAAFSTSVMATSNPPQDHKPGDLPDIGKLPFPQPDWCKNWPPGVEKPTYWYKFCGWG